MTPAEGLQCLKRPIEQLADAYLGQPEFPRSKKVIHDAIWGTQQLHPHEVAVLDSRLLQRLRYLHQTGLSYLTYPSTTHSRFEHTLGVLYQAIAFREHSQKNTANRKASSLLRYPLKSGWRPYSTTVRTASSPTRAKRFTAFSRKSRHVWGTVVNMRQSRPVRCSAP